MFPPATVWIFTTAIADLKSCAAINFMFPHLIDVKILDDVAKMWMFELGNTSEFSSAKIQARASYTGSSYTPIKVAI